MSTLGCCVLRCAVKKILQSLLLVLGYFWRQQEPIAICGHKHISELITISVCSFWADPNQLVVISSINQPYFGIPCSNRKFRWEKTEWKKGWMCVWMKAAIFWGIFKRQRMCMETNVKMEQISKRFNYSWWMGAFTAFGCTCVCVCVRVKRQRGNNIHFQALKNHFNFDRTRFETLFQSKANERK